MPSTFATIGSIPSLREYDRFIGTQAEFCRLHGTTGSSLRYWWLKQETAFVEMAALEAAAWDVDLVILHRECVLQAALELSKIHDLDGDR